ncbi:DUF2029 domain-containing protein [bacterium]|nr:DUF2029 domain-containing protein [bacterium]
MLASFAKGKTWKVLYWLQWGLLAGLTFQAAQAPYGGHYGIFTQAGSYLFAGKNPYGVDWGYGGLWFYSPAFGWFFGLLNFFPKAVGIFIFNFLSHIFLLEGLRRFINQLGVPAKNNLYLSLLIIASSGEFIGAYQHIRPEMLILGLLLIVFDLSLVRPILSACLAALIVNFKMFPIAAVGLLCLTHLKERKFRFPLLFPFFLILWFAVPLLVYSGEFVKSLYEIQQQTLSAYVDVMYDDFYSVFGLLHHTFGVSVPRAAITPVLIFFAVLLAAILWFGAKDRAERLAFGVSLGLLYTVNFNLLSQSSAFCLATPAFALGLYLCFTLEGKSKQTAGVVMCAYWVLVSLVFSDWVPHSLRDLCREARIKPLGSLILMGYFLILLGTSRRRKILVA